MRSRRFDRLFDKLAAAEQAFLDSEFLAPAVAGGAVRVRIAGVVCNLRVTPADFEGWGVFKPTSHATAEFVRPAGLAERRRYLALFPLVWLILCTRGPAGGSRSLNGGWLALPAHQGDRRFEFSGLVPVRLAEEAQQFDVIRTRFDGANFWFEGSETARDPATAAYLRESLRQTTDPDRLDRPGLTPEERAAYALNYLAKEEVRRQREIDRTWERIEQALRHAGAGLVDYLERRDSYRVTFTLGGRKHVSAIRKDDFTVQAAGICLSGRDQAFDLASLVGVIREAEGTGQIVPIGHENAGLEAEQYWQVHPPENRE